MTLQSAPGLLRSGDIDTHDDLVEHPLISGPSGVSRFVFQRPQEGPPANVPDRFTGAVIKLVAGEGAPELIGHALFAEGGEGPTPNG